MTSNLKSEAHLEEQNPSREANLQAAVANPMKKKSGFQITSVTDTVDSGHGRPASDVREGEESADDLDESHASYSDVSYSRVTDAERDQESMVSEDALNLSMHDSANDSSVNRAGTANHGHLTYSAQKIGTPQRHDVSTKARSPKDAPVELKKAQRVRNVTFAISNNSLAKQHSDPLDSPEHLPLEGTRDGIEKDRFSEVFGKKIDLPQNTNASVKDSLSRKESEQNCILPSTVSSDTSTTTVSELAAASANGGSTETVAIARQQFPQNTVSVFSTPKTMRPTAISGNKARVYKVVVRSVKRTRGRWSWYDVNDPHLQKADHCDASLDKRPSNMGLLQTLAYENTLMPSNAVQYPMQRPNSASPLFISGQLLSTESSDNSSTRNVSVMDLREDVLTSAMKKYAGISSNAHGDVSMVDTSAAERTLKIDNKIEVAMDLVKKHLMSAVRDEVDDLKEKIKDLLAENTQLKAENKQLRAMTPPDVVLSQVMAIKSLPEELSANENRSNVDQASNTNIAESAVTNTTTTLPMTTNQVQTGAVVNMPLRQNGPALLMDALGTTSAESPPTVPLAAKSDMQRPPARESDFDKKRSS